MSEPTMSGGFDPRRLADLASRIGPRPVPAEPAPAATDQQPPAADQQSAAMGQQSAAPVPRPPASVPAPPASVPAPPVGDAAGPAGQPHLEAIVAELERAEGLPPDQQIPVYESVHRTLQETLRSIEQS